MAIGSISSASQDFYLATLQKYGLGSAASPTPSTSTDSAGASGEAATDTYTPSPLVAQALASATATLTNADASLFTATRFSPSLNPSGASNGFVVAIDMTATLALAAYTNSQNGIPVGQTAAELASTNTRMASNNDSDTLQNAIQAARATALSSTLNLFV